MTCEISDRDQRLDDFLMKKLSAEQAEAFEIHLFSCKDCLAELRLREQMIKIIKEERVTVVSEVVRPRRAKPPAGLIQTIADSFKIRPNLWIYASVAVALLVAILVFPSFRGQESAENYAANFAASPRLESLIGQTLRSSDLFVSVASPRNGERFSSGKISFHWQIKRNEEIVDLPLEIKILNNQEALIHSARVVDGEYLLSRYLPLGLYYWTIENQGEVLFLGKFFVR